MDSVGNRGDMDRGWMIWGGELGLWSGRCGLSWGWRILMGWSWGCGVIFEMGGYYTLYQLCTMIFILARISLKTIYYLEG